METLFVSVMRGGSQLCWRYGSAEHFRKDCTHCQRVERGAVESELSQTTVGTANSWDEDRIQQHQRADPDVGSLLTEMEARPGAQLGRYQCSRPNL